MNQASTRFSLIVASYNMAPYIEQCLQSLTRQHYSQDLYEIICVEDGSTDDSPKIIEAIARESKNLRVYRIPNSGLEKACNLGIEKSVNGWIIRVDADDFLDLNYLEVMGKAIRQNPGYAFYYTLSYEEFYSESRRQKKQLPAFDREEILSRGDFFATGTVYRKDLLQKIGNFPAAVKNCGLENYSVILELLSRGHEGLGVSGTSFSYRRHETNMSLVKRQAIIEFGKGLLARHGRVFQTNANHPYNLVLDAEVKK